MPELAAALGWNRESGGQLVSYGPPPHIDREAWFQSDSSRYYDERPTIPDIDVMAALRSLPSVTVARQAGSPWSFYEDWLSHPPYHPYFDRLAGTDDDDQFAVPALHISSWYDYNITARMGFQLYSRNGTTPEARSGQFLVLGPGTHCEFMDGAVAEGNEAPVKNRSVGEVRYDYVRHYLDWFSYWLMGIDNDVTRRPKVQYFVMGKEGGWRSASNWPLPNSRSLAFYLASDGNANSRRGDGVLVREPGSIAKIDTFAYDPAEPAPSRGGLICCTGSLEDRGGATDQSTMQLREDVLVYASAPLEQPLTVVGAAHVELYVSSDAPDTDFTVKLSDVDLTGNVWILSDGIMRMRYRNGLDERAPTLEPDKVYKVVVQLQAIGIRFDVGHRVQLEISSSAFPRWERNLNTGGNNFDESVPRVAVNSVHHSAEHWSRVVLPIIELTE